MKYLEHILLTRLATDKDIDLSPRATERRNYEYSQFKDQNRNRDEHFSSTYNQSITGVSECTLVHNEKLGDLPWFGKGSLVCLLDFLLLGWWLRYNLVRKTPECFYKLEKYVIE